MNRKDFILHLIGEISSYILEENPMRMVISLHQEEDGLHLCVIDDNHHTDEEGRLPNTRNAFPGSIVFTGWFTIHDSLPLMVTPHAFLLEVLHFWHVDCVQFPAQSDGRLFW